MARQLSSTQRPAAHKAGVRGFTLIELMITVVVASILATIAIPAYTNQIRKSRRTDARTALLDLASREERYFSTANKYSAVATDLGYAAWPASVGGNYYNISTPRVQDATAARPAGFTLTAVPVAGNGQDHDTQCTTFIVDGTGMQSSKDASNTDTTKTCWN
jgi:type IV pilus assembly protein PilE